MYYIRSVKSVVRGMGNLLESCTNPGQRKVYNYAIHHLTCNLTTSDHLWLIIGHNMSHALCMCICIYGLMYACTRCNCSTVVIVLELIVLRRGFVCVCFNRPSIIVDIASCTSRACVVVTSISES